MSAITVRIGDLAAATTAAVVRPARSDGEAITAAGRRIDVAAGPALAKHLEGLGELPVGGAVLTPGGSLASPFVIHAVLQSADEPVSALAVQRALVNVLRRARDLGLDSVALPPIGVGAGNLDAEDAAHLLVEVLRDHLRDGAAPRRFEIFVEGPYEEELYTREARAGDLAEDVL